MSDTLTHLHVKQAAKTVYFVYARAGKIVDRKAPNDDGLLAAVQRLFNLKQHLYRLSKDLEKAGTRHPAKFKREGSKLHRHVTSIETSIQEIGGNHGFFDDPELVPALKRAHASLIALAEQFPRPR